MPAFERAEELASGSTGWQRPGDKKSIGELWPSCKHRALHQMEVEPGLLPTFGSGDPFMPLSCLCVSAYHRTRLQKSRAENASGRDRESDLERNRYELSHEGRTASCQIRDAESEQWHKAIDRASRFMLRIEGLSGAPAQHADFRQGREQSSTAETPHHKLR